MLTERAGPRLSGRDGGPAIGVPGETNCRLRVNSGVITSSGLLETGELVGGAGGEARPSVSPGLPEKLSKEVGVGGESSGRRWYGRQRARALLIVVHCSFFPPGTPRSGLGLGETQDKKLRS